MEKFRKDLEEVNFPTLLLNDESLNEVLLKPGKSRLRMLQWCMSNIDNTVKEELAVSDDELTNALLTVAHKYCICTDKKEDESVFLGNRIMKKQIKFWNMMFDLVKGSQNHKTNSSCLDFASDECDSKGLKIRINLIPVDVQVGLALATNMAAPEAHAIPGSAESNAKVGMSTAMRRPDVCSKLEAAVTSVHEACNTFNAELQPDIPPSLLTGQQSLSNVISAINTGLDCFNQCHDAFRNYQRDQASIQRRSTLYTENTVLAINENLSNVITECNRIVNE